MSGTKLTPEKITSPMQLMAAWFSMLVLLTGVLLAAAGNIASPPWGAAYLIIFASIVVVAVIAIVFCMLTVFRPHLQEGKEYAQWLKSKGGYSETKVPGSQRAKPVKRPSVKSNVFVPHPSSGPTEDHEGVSSSVPALNSCWVSVVNIQGALRLASKLSEAGFKVDIYKDQFDEEQVLDAAQQESIWIGSNVPVTEVINAIRIAVQEWPFLKYLHLSADTAGNPPYDIHEEIFIGGSSSTSEQLKLLPWSNEELLSLDETMSIKELHAAVRRKY